MEGAMVINLDYLAAKVITADETSLFITSTRPLRRPPPLLSSFMPSKIRRCVCHDRSIVSVRRDWLPFSPKSQTQTGPVRVLSSDDWLSE